VELVCRGGSLINQVSQKPVSVEKTSCSKRQEPRISRTKGKCARAGADGRRKGLNLLTRVSIGWNISGIFHEQIGLCVDETMFATLWTNHTIHGANIAFRDIDSGRPAFRADTSKNHRFFPWTSSSKLNYFYSKNYQQSQMKMNLKTNNQIDGQKIIETSSSGVHYFAKGHLSPDAAFVTNTLQDATYYFANVAPQFQSFNNGNWKALEYNTRDLASKLGRDLNVMTGTHDILEYPNSDNILTPIFLYNSSYVPAPKYYWKVVRDPQTDTAAAFIGLNDPHAKTAPRDLCSNKCPEMAWVDWNVSDLSAGYMYCCSVQQAARAISSIPYVSSKGLIQLSPMVPPKEPGEVPAPDQASCTTGPCTCSCPGDGRGGFTCTCTCILQAV